MDKFVFWGWKSAELDKFAQESYAEEIEKSAPGILGLKGKKYIKSNKGYKIFVYLQNKCSKQSDETI